jgi:hypothetical protein
MSYFDIRTPTNSELLNCEHIEIKSPNVDWEPCSEKFAEEEAKLNETDGTTPPAHYINSIRTEVDDFPDKIYASNHIRFHQWHQKRNCLSKQRNLQRNGWLA